MTNRPIESAATFESPLVTRYASKEIVDVFTPHNRALLWRDLWIALAESQHTIGLSVTEKQVAQLKEHRSRIDHAEVARYEKETRHEVIAHIRHLGDLCPEARPIIHLGATSAYVMDNGDLLQLRLGLRIVARRVADVLKTGAALAEQTAGIPVLGYTHLQPAQPTTLGKRVALWMQDFLIDLQNAESALSRLRFRGIKGATGTQASFMRLLDFDSAKVKKLDKLVAKAMGFDRLYGITAQTYPRKVDIDVLNVLMGIAQSAHKMSNDIRFLQAVGEAEEPFGAHQVGSSAMAYKRNPMRSERIAGLSRLIITAGQNSYWNAANQWMERTLDDSSNRRIVLAESFLATDAVLILCRNVLDGFHVNRAVIDRRLWAKLPLLATEDILMAAVERGGDRQDLHERIRLHSMESVRKMREDGIEECDLLERLARDDAFSGVHAELERIVSPDRLLGRAEAQVEEFLEFELQPALANYPAPTDKEEVRV